MKRNQLFLFPPQIINPKFSLPKTVPIIDPTNTTVKNVASEYLKIKKSGNIPDGNMRSLMIKAFPAKFMTVHRSTLEDYSKAHGPQKSLILTNNYIQSLLYAQSMSTAPFPSNKIQAEEIWSDLSKTDLNFSNETYLSFLKCYEIVKDKVMVEKIHDLLVRNQKKQQWDRNVYAGLINAHHTLGNKYAIKRLFEAFEKQFAHINKCGFLCPINTNLNIKLKNMVFQYFAALVSAKNNAYFTILLDKISRMTSDHIYSILDEHSYDVIFSFLSLTVNTEMASRYFKMVKYHHESTPLKYTVFYKALDCLSKVSDFPQVQMGYKVLLNIRNAAVANANIEAGMNLSVKDITNLFIKYVITSTPQPELSKFRSWISPLPPLEIQSIMAYSAGKTLNPSLIRKFLKSSIITSDYLLLYWARQISLNQRSLNELYHSTQFELDGSKFSSNLSPVVKSKSIVKLKELISWINRRKKRGIQHLYGLNGPLSTVYSGLIGGWQEGKILIGDLNQDPLKFDSLLEEMEDLEKKILLESDIGKYLRIRIDDKMD